MYLNLAEVLKKILNLSPDEAAAERGFSVIKTVLVDNLSVISLVSQRLIHDYMNAKNLLPQTLEITASLHRHIRSPCQRYQQDLDDQTNKNVSNGKQLKKNILNEQIETVTEKKRTLVNTINKLHIDNDLYISHAEGCSSLKEIKSLLAKSTFYEKNAEEKEQEVKNCNGTMNKSAKIMDNI